MESRSAASISSLSLLLQTLHNASSPHYSSAFHTLVSAISHADPPTGFQAAVGLFCEKLSSTASAPSAINEPQSSFCATGISRKRDYIALGAVGNWSDVVLADETSANVLAGLNFDILRLVFDNTLGVFLNGSTVSLPQQPGVDGKAASAPAGVSPRFVLKHNDTSANIAELHVWGSFQRARRHVLQVSLASRYGSAHLAPKATMVAGAPLILYISQRTPASARIVPAGTADRAQSLMEDAAREWADIGMGLCVLETLEVDSASSLRGEVGSRFKDAVWNKGLSPTLIVLHLDADTTLCDGIGVLRAICDGYGSRLHVEGPATAMFLAGREAENLEHDVALAASSAHSIVIDVASWFGVRDGSVLSSVRLPPPPDGQMSPTLDPAFVPPRASAASTYPLWFLLEVSSLERRAGVLKSACRYLNDIIDALLEYAHLIQYRLVGCGAYLLLSYAQSDADPALKSSLNKAMLAHVSRDKRARRFHLRVVRFDDMDWICFSPLLVLESAEVYADLCAGDVKVLTGLLVAAVKRIEIATAGRAAFMASMKQCADVELLEAEGDVGCEGSLQFGALRVVPLGLAAGNGHWQRDKEMCEQVEKFTFALGSVLESDTDKRFEGVLVDDPSSVQKTFIYVGPKVELENRVMSTDRLDAAELGARPSWTLFGPNSPMRMSEAKETEESRNEKAREIAREAAGDIAASVQKVIASTKVAPDEGLPEDVVPDEKEAVPDAPVAVEESEAVSMPESPVVDDRTHMLAESMLGERMENSLVPTSEVNSEELDKLSNEPPVCEDAAESPKTVRQPVRKSSSLWKSFFYRAFGSSGEDESDSDTSVKSDAVLEEDFFRV